MKIGVDVRVLMDKYYSGISEYAANLLTAILKIDDHNNYRLFYNSYHDVRSRLVSWEKPNAQLIGTRWPNKLFNYCLQKICAWPKLDRVLGGVDVFWSPHFNFTSLQKKPNRPRQIITVHDLSFLRYPKFFSFRKNFWHRALGIKKILKGTDAIVAVSENTKQDIVELIGIDPSKITVIYSGLNNLPAATPSETEAFITKHQLAGRFILYLGNIEPRKNIAGLIKAFNILCSDDQNQSLADLQLVIAGGSGWRARTIYQAYRQSPYKNRIKFVGYVSPIEKSILYSRASVFAYPSYYEGFGFPPLEAMAAGVPVVCSNLSSLPEIVASGALMINPHRPEEIARVLREVLRDEVLRKQLIDAGRLRAQSFSWEKAAREYLRLFSSFEIKDNYEKK